MCYFNAKNNNCGCCRTDTCIVLVAHMLYSLKYVPQISKSDSDSTRTPHISKKFWWNFERISVFQSLCTFQIICCTLCLKSGWAKLEAIVSLVSLCVTKNLVEGFHNHFLSLVELEIVPEELLALVEGSQVGDLQLSGFGLEAFNGNFNCIGCACSLQSSES